MSNYTKQICVRIDRDVITKIDKLAKQSFPPNRSYYINVFLDFCINHLQARDIYRIYSNRKKGIYKLKEIQTPAGCNTEPSK